MNNNSAWKKTGEPIPVTISHSGDNYSFIDLNTGRVYQMVSHTEKTHTGNYFFTDTNIVKDGKVCSAIKERGKVNETLVSAQLYKVRGKSGLYLWEY